VTEPLEVSVHIAAHPEIVFGYFTDPARYTRWMGRRATLNPVPGGTYRVDMREGVTAAGEFVEFDPPHRLVFTWGWANDPSVPPGSTRVEVTLTPDGDGTRLRLVHRDLPAPSRAQHDKGWEHFLDRLRAAAAGDDPGPDPWAA
jgi:uncharacterized protein YndB with AHSA1/START domain